MECRRCRCRCGGACLCLALALGRLFVAIVITVFSGCFVIPPPPFLLVGALPVHSRCRCPVSYTSLLILSACELPPSSLLPPRLAHLPTAFDPRAPSSRRTSSNFYESVRTKVKVVFIAACHYLSLCSAIRTTSLRCAVLPPHIVHL